VFKAAGAESNILLKTVVAAESAYVLVDIIDVSTDTAPVVSL
jgi:hypothetical protein